MSKRICKRWIGGILAVVILLTNITVIVSANDDWSDIQDYYPFSSWATDVGNRYKIIFLEDNKRAASRLEITNLLFNLISIEKVQGTTSQFSDISSINDVLKERITKMLQAGIISGYEDGTFRPNNPVTRAEFVTMLCRTKLLKTNSKVEENLFKDVINHWAEEDINKIAKLGIVAGKGNDEFWPEDNITPEELLIILDRLAELKYIPSCSVISAVQDTFKSKVYGSKEQYIIERMYSQFDEIQGFMKYNWPYKSYYDPSLWNELATVNDIQYVIYFMMSRNYQVEESGESRVIFDKIGEILLQNKKNEGNYYTMSDFLSCIMPCQIATGVGKWRNFSYDKSLGIMYTNFNKLENSDRENISNILQNDKSILLENISMEFPIDVPITKYMLNYFAMKMEETYAGYREAWKYWLYDYIGKTSNFVTKGSDLPSNYNEYPYIVYGIPKEAYERPFIYSDKFEVNPPINCFAKYSNAMERGASYASNYFDAILNVDYKNLNEQKFSKDVSTCLYYVPEEDIAEYIQYVKQNEIVLSGKGFAIPGTLYISDGFLYVRAILQFEVVSAKDMKNLLFGDMRFGLPDDVKYNSKSYTLYVDLPLTGGPTIYDGEVRHDIYKLSYSPIVEGIHWYGTNYNLP